MSSDSSAPAVLIGFGAFITLDSDFLSLIWFLVVIGSCSTSLLEDSFFDFCFYILLLDCIMLLIDSTFEVDLVASSWAIFLRSLGVVGVFMTKEASF